MKKTIITFEGTSAATAPVPSNKRAGLAVSAPIPFIRQQLEAILAQQSAT